MNTYRGFDPYRETKIDKAVQGAIGLVLLGLIIAGAYFLGNLALDAAGYAEQKRATAECEKWADQAKVHPEYFIVDWQKSQCDTYGVEIGAPVKNY